MRKKICALLALLLVSVRVEPTADGEAVHSATLKHDGSKENFEITVEDTVALF